VALHYADAQVAFIVERSDRKNLGNEIGNALRVLPKSDERFAVCVDSDDELAEHLTRLSRLQSGQNLLRLVICLRKFLNVGWARLNRGSNRVRGRHGDVWHKSICDVRDFDAIANPVPFPPLALIAANPVVCDIGSIAGLGQEVPNTRAVRGRGEEIEVASRKLDGRAFCPGFDDERPRRVDMQWPERDALVRLLGRARDRKRECARATIVGRLLVFDVGVTGAWMDRECEKQTPEAGKRRAWTI
jgi:hypothetical protein